MSSIVGPHVPDPAECDDCLNSPVTQERVVVHLARDEEGRIFRVEPRPRRKKPADHPGQEILGAAQ